MAGYKTWLSYNRNDLKLDCHVSPVLPLPTCSETLPIYLFFNSFFYDIQQYQTYSFANDNTIYACGQNLDSIDSNIKSEMKATLQFTGIKAMRWLQTLKNPTNLYRSNRLYSTVYLHKCHFGPFD